MFPAIVVGKLRVDRWSRIALFVIGCFFAQRFGAAVEPVTATRLYPAGAQQGSTVTVVFKGKFPNPDLSVWTNRAGILWTPGDEQGKFQAEIAPDAPAGLYYVRVVDSVSASSLLPFMVGNLPEVQEVEPNQTPSEATEPLTLPVIANGILEGRGDVDGFRVQVAAGKLLIASLQANQGLQSPVDMVMQLTDELGNVLATNHDYHGLDPLIAWTSDRDRTVIVRIFGFPSAPDSSIALSGGENYLYRLALTTGPFLEATQPLALQANVENQLMPIGWGIEESVTPLVVSPPSESVFMSVQFEGMAGQVDLPVLPFPAITEATTANASVPGDVSIPVCVTGIITVPNEVDRFQFQAEKDKSLILKVESRSLGCPLDAVLQVETLEGKVLQRVDDVGNIADPTIRWKAPETGTYRVSIADVNSYASLQSYYRLTIEYESADFQLRTSNDILAAKIGEPLEVSVAIDRIAGFDKSVRIAAESLPTGVTCEPVISEPSGDSAKEVKLKLVCSQALNAPISIVGATQEDQSLVKQVQADKGIGLLWLYAQ